MSTRSRGMIDPARIWFPAEEDELRFPAEEDELRFPAEEDELGIRTEDMVPRRVMAHDAAPELAG